MVKSGLEDESIKAFVSALKSDYVKWNLSKRLLMDENAERAQ